MDNRLKKVEDIMQEYQEFKESLEPKIDDTLIEEIASKKQELEREENILQAFKDELNHLNTNEMDYTQMHVTMGNYKRYIDESQTKVNQYRKEYEEKLAEKEKIENPDSTLDEKREKSSKTIQARDKAKKGLLEELNEINQDIEEQEIALQQELLAMKKFKYEYEEQEQTWQERDDNGELVTVTKKVQVPINGEEFKKLDTNFKETQENLNNLKDAKSKCEEYIQQIDNEYKKEVEEINNIISRKKPNAKQEEQEKEDKKTENKEKVDNKEQKEEKQSDNSVPTSSNPSKETRTKTTREEKTNKRETTKNNPTPNKKVQKNNKEEVKSSSEKKSKDNATLVQEKDDDAVRVLKNQINLLRHNGFKEESPEIQALLGQLAKELQNSKTANNKQATVHKEPELKWHPKLSEIEIADAIERGIDKPKGNEYRQFLIEHGIKPELVNSKSEPTKSEPTKSEPTKPEPTKPEPTKTEPTKPEPTKPEIEETDLVLISFNAKKKSYHLVINGKVYSEDSKDVLELIESEEFDMFKAKLFNDYREAKGLEHVDPCVAYLLEKVDNQLGQHRLDNYMKALGKEDKISDFTTISYDLNGIFGRKYDSQLSEDILRTANYHGENGLAELREKSRFTQFMEKHDKLRKAYETITKIGKERTYQLGEKNKKEELGDGNKHQQEQASNGDLYFHILTIEKNIENVQTLDGLKQIYDNVIQEKTKNKLTQQEFESLQDKIGRKGVDLKGKIKKNNLTEPEKNKKNSFKERLKFSEEKEQRKNIKKAPKSKYSVKEKFKDGVRKAKEVRNARKNKPLEGEKIENPRPRNLKKEANNAKTVDYIEL